MSTAPLLVELLVEEMPPRSLKKLGDAFARLIADSLIAQGLAPADARVTPYATPRRLALHVADVSARAADKPARIKLMPVAVALDAAGEATPALHKKLAALGLGPDAADTLEVDGEGRAAALYLNTVTPGATLVDGLQIAFDTMLAGLPIPKVMQYPLADGWTGVAFVRPAHGLVALHGRDIVPIAALGLAAGRDTRGHRFEAQRATIAIADADAYAEQLRDEGAVIASFAERRAEIERQLAAVAQTCNGTPIHDDALLDEVTALVERPNVLLGRFDDAFLKVPQECLILTMKANQKYFPLLDAHGKLTNRFLIVSNISPADASAVVGGNERVVRPRLADAKFFYDQDRKKTLESRVPELAKVVYHNKLGTQAARVERVRASARAIAGSLGGDALATLADRAALLAKADLLTDMVGEFPELQGVMGRYYALYDGEDAAVAAAIEDHYKPRFAGDELPRDAVGVCVALADKLDTLVGLFGIGEKPTGDKDPFALRRHALGVIRLLGERAPALELPQLLRTAAQTFDAALRDDSLAELASFIYERLANSLRDSGAAAPVVDAVLALRPARLGDVGPRIEAVLAFSALAEAPALAAANKRVGNILKKAAEPLPDAIDPQRFCEPAEHALYAAMVELEPRAGDAFATADYATSLRVLAGLKAPVDAFFDQVMVNADDPAIRANRLALLARLYALMNRVAELAKLSA